MGAFYKNEDQTLYVKRDIGDSVALCQCVAQELGHAELSMNSEGIQPQGYGFQAVCIEVYALRNTASIRRTLRLTVSPMN